jgi:hypothetical protein
VVLGPEAYGPVRADGLVVDDSHDSVWLAVAASTHNAG